MKKCPYCGKEYPDEATVCIIDAHPLIDPSKPTVEEAPPVKEEPPPPKPEPAKDDTHLIWPDYQWSARDAWKCIGILCMLLVVNYAINDVQYSILPHFYRSGFGYVCRLFLFFATWIITTCYFARIETLATFWKGFGLNRRPTHLVWFGIVMALAMRLFNNFMVNIRGGPLLLNYEIESFRNTIGFERLFFAVPIVLFAPFFEECIFRGFLYRAFRSSYSVPISMILIVVLTCFTHWWYYSHSLITGVILSVFAIILCYIREKSDSLWDCIFCHFAFNASVLFLSP